MAVKRSDAEKSLVKYVKLEKNKPPHTISAFNGAVASLYIFGGRKNQPKFFLIFCFYCFPNLLRGMILDDYLWFVLSKERAA